MKKQICVIVAFVYLLAGGIVQAMDISQQIFEAAKSGNITKVQELIGQGVSVNSRTDDGHTPLHAAAANCHLDVAQLLLAHEADINAQDNNGTTPLCWSVKASLPWTPVVHQLQLDMTQLLLDRGADHNIQDNVGYTPLHWALGIGYLHITKALIFAGANIFAKDKKCRTPLDLAKNIYNLELRKNVVRILVLKGLEDDLNCPICLDEKPKIEITVFPCCHYTCRECLQELQNQLNSAQQQLIQVNERLLQLEQQGAPREQIIEVFQERQNLINLLQSGLTCPICRKPFKFEEVY